MEQYDRLVRSMARLNAHAAEAVSKCPVIHACTDVTGFGLLGHADEMARGSGVTIRLYSRRLPLLPGALEFAEMGIIPAGAYRNLDYVKPRLTVAESVQQARVDLISDPQTSGGLLVALPMEEAGALLAALRERDPDCKIILVDDTQEFAVRGMRLHCTDFILRPVEFRHIVRSMNLALRGRL